MRRLPRYALPVLGPEIHKASCACSLSGPVFGEDSNIWVVLSICGYVLAPSVLAREDVENSVQYRSRMLLAWLQLAKSPRMQPGHNLNGSLIQSSASPASRAVMAPRSDLLVFA